jgi:hypothetical protein
MNRGLRRSAADELDPFEQPWVVSTAVVAAEPDIVECPAGAFLGTRKQELHHQIARLTPSSR